MDMVKLYIIMTFYKTSVKWTKFSFPYSDIDDGKEHIYM